MYYTGFADEAGNDIDTQIRVTRELGWKNIESRGLNGSNLADLDEAGFDTVRAKLSDAGICINCYGSAVANWGKDPRKEEDYHASVEELRRVLPRMKVLGTEMIRGMSFQMLKDQIPYPSDLEDMVISKVGKLVRMCEDAGVTYVHENCMNYGGMSWEHSLRLIERIGSPALKLVFDTGNPVGAFDIRGEPPYTKKQDPWDFYDHVKDHIVYVHIKDGIYVKEGDGLFAEQKMTYPGEGHGKVREIVADLLRNGYDGGFSIEPHMGAVYHDPSVKSDADSKYKTYIEYGKRFMKLVEEVLK